MFIKKKVVSTVDFRQKMTENKIRIFEQSDGYENRNFKNSVLAHMPKQSASIRGVKEATFSSVMF